MNNLFQKAKKTLATILSLALVLGHFNGIANIRTVFAAHDDQVIYSLATDNVLQDLETGVIGVGADGMPTPYLNNAGSPTFSIIEHTHGGNAIEVANRGASHYGIDIQRNAIGFELGQHYSIRISGYVVDAPAGTQMIIGGPDNPWNWLASQAPNADGQFDFTATVRAAQLNDPQFVRGFRLQTNNTATFVIEEIVVTHYGPDATYNPGDNDDDNEPVDGIVKYDITFGADWADYQDYIEAASEMTGTRVTDFGRTDNYSFRLENTTGQFVSSGNALVFDPPTPLQAGGRYSVSWWIYIPADENPNLQAAGAVGPGLVLNEFAGRPALQPTNSIPAPGDLARRVPTGEWVQTTTFFDVGTDTGGNVNRLFFRFRVNDEAQQPRVYFIDDIVITQIDLNEDYDTPEWDLTLPSLHEAFADYFVFGNILEPNLINQNPNGVLEMFLHHYNSVTAENAMKPDMVSGGGTQTTRPAELNLAGPRTMVDFAQANDLYMVGHTLLWHEQSAPWLYLNTDGTLLSRAEAMENMRWFISEYAGYFEGRIDAWDVTNEIFTNSGENNNVNNSPTGSPIYPAGSWQRALRNYASWYQAFANGADFAAGERGWDYIYYAYVFARTYAPSALLIYNDFNDEFPNKRNAMANMVEELNERWANDPVNNPAYGNPNHADYGRLLIEVIGMQAHYNQGTNLANVRASIERFVQTGARIHVTELDITIAPGAPFLTDAQLAHQADMFGQLFEWYVEFSDYIDRVTIWGREDGSSWRGDRGPTLFDRNLNPKPAFWAVLAASQTEPVESVLVYSLADDAGIQDLAVGATGSSIFNNTPYLTDSGSPVFTIVEHPTSGGNSIAVTGRTADWNTMDLLIAPLNFDPMFTYNVTVVGRVTGGYDDSTQAQVFRSNSPWQAFASQTPNADGSFVLEFDVYNGMTPTLENTAFRIRTNDNADFIIDEIIVYRPGTTDDGNDDNGDNDTNDFEPVVVFFRDFEDGEIAGGDGGQFAVVPNPLGEGLVQRITTSDSWHGLQIPADVFLEGATYLFEADVLRPADSTSMNARFEGANNPWPWVVGNHPISNTEWTTITGEFTWDPVNPMPVRLVNGGAGIFYADNVTVTRIAIPVEEDEPGDEPFVPEIIHHWDFTADTLDSFSIEIAGNPVMNHIPGTGWEITASNDWMGPRLSPGIMEAGAEYRLDIVLRSDSPGFELQPRRMPGFGWINNFAVGSSWTEISFEWAADDQAGLNFGSNATGSSWTYIIQEMTLTRIVPAPYVPEINEWEDLVFDFADGYQGWFARSSATSVSFERVHTGPNSSYALRVADRLSQGDGPMLDVVDYLVPFNEFTFTAYARFIEPSNGLLTLSTQTGASSFTNLVQNMEVGQEWTQIGGTFTMPAFTDMARIYLETPWQSGAAGDTAAFEIAHVVISRPAERTFQRDLPGLFTSLDVPTVGVAVDSRELHGVQGEMVLHHFNHIVGENHMKPEAWFAGQGMSAFRRHPQATAMLDFAQENDVTLFGHVLFWHSQHPGTWFFTDTGLPGGRQLDFRVPGDSEIMRDRMQEFVHLVAEDITRDYGLFGSDTNPMNSWEVVNEVVAGNPNVASGMRETSPFFQAFGPGADGFGSDFMIYAFLFADYYINGVFHVDGENAVLDVEARTVTGTSRTENRITLWINDYNTERGLDSFIGGERQLNRNTKRYVLLNITNWLIDNGAPIDGVGHQFHAGLQWPVQGLNDALQMFTYSNGHVNAPLLQAITEIDVTIPDINEANLLAQGHYYYAAFEIIRRHQATYGDIDNVTIWGLTDNRSWRADQAPLLFDADLQAKPAFFGALMGGIGYLNETPDWDFDLVPVVLTANVFGGEVTLDTNGWNNQIDLLPLENFATGTGGFSSRWTEDALYIIADLPVVAGEIRAPGGNAGRRLQVEYAGLDFIVWPDSVLTDATGNYLDIEEVTTFVNDNAWIVRIEHSALINSDTNLVVTSIEGSQQSPQAHVWDGTITFREVLSVTNVILAQESPDFNSPIWNEAEVIYTGVNTGGNASGTGATAEVRTVWVDGGAGFSYLYILAEVNDNTPNNGNASRHENDSVEVFVSLGNNRGASYEHLYDLQVRFHRNGEVDINGTPPGVHAQRVNHEVLEVEGGYKLLGSIRLATDTGHLQGNWNSSFGNIDEVIGFDVQVNDARNGSRYSAMIWADPTGQSWMSTYRWGVARLVETLTEDLPGSELDQARANLESLLLSVELLESEDFTTYSWNLLLTAVELAVFALELNELEIILIATEVLTLAIDALVEVDYEVIPEPNPEFDNAVLALFELVEIKSLVENNNFTEDSWNAFISSLAVAEQLIEVIKNGYLEANDVTIQLINSVKEALISTYSALIEVEEDTGDDNQGDDNQGDDNQGDNNQGDNNQGDNNQGGNNQGGNNQGGNNQGGNNQGGNNQGGNNQGGNNQGGNNQGGNNQGGNNQGNNRPNLPQTGTVITSTIGLGIALAAVGAIVNHKSKQK